jgi:hypothetical protein
MDNLFEVLIYLIIIISFLSSIFRKKNKDLPKPTRQSPETKQRDFDFQVDQQNRSEQPGTYSSKENEYDMLKEIENLFKTETERKQESTVRPPVPGTRFETRSRQEHEPSEWNEPTITEHSQTYSEHVSTESLKTEGTKIARKIPKIDSKVAERAERFEKLLRKKHEPDDKFVKIIRQKLANPRSLKEYIVMSEIIGKPKSLL